MTLVAVLVTPLVALATYGLLKATSEQREFFAGQSDVEAEHIAQIVSAEFNKMSVMLDVIASSGWLEEGDLATLHRRAKTALQGTGIYLIVLDRQYNQILNTRVEFGKPLGKTSNLEAAKKTQNATVPYVSELFLGQIANALVFNVMQPTNAGGIPRILILTRNAESLGTVVTPVSSDDSAWNYAVFDPAGQVATAAFVNESERENTPSQCKEKLPAAAFRSGELLGRSLKIARSDWSVCVWRRAATGETLAFWLPLFAIIFLILAAMIIAVAAGRIISRDIRGAALVARAVSRRKDLPAFSPRIRETSEVIDALTAADEAIKDREAKQKLTLQETAHRARNLLTVAQSLTRMSATSAKSVDNFRDGLLARLGALGRSVEALSRAGWFQASFHQVIQTQVAPYAPAEAWRLSLGGDDLTLSPGAAQALALVFNELATNATKYGGWSQPDGKVTVTLKIGPQTITVLWRERYRVPAERSADGPEQIGFGTTLISTVVEQQFGGEANRRYEQDGYSCTITLPITSLRKTA